MKIKDKFYFQEKNVLLYKESCIFLHNTTVMKNNV